MRVRDLEEQLKERDNQIALLESQVRELGALNEDLTEQLNGEPTEGGAKEAADNEEAKEGEAEPTAEHTGTDQSKQQAQELAEDNDVQML